jgi:hypothetical protein
MVPFALVFLAAFLFLFARTIGAGIENLWNIADRKLLLFHLI